MPRFQDIIGNMKPAGWSDPFKHKNDDDSVLDVLAGGLKSGAGAFLNTTGNLLESGQRPDGMGIDEWRAISENLNLNPTTRWLQKTGSEIQAANVKDYTPGSAKYYAHSLLESVPEMGVDMLAAGAIGAGVGAAAGPEGIAAGALINSAAKGGKWARRALNAFQGHDKIAKAVTFLDPAAGTLAGGISARGMESIMEGQRAADEFIAEAKANGTYQAGVTENQADALRSDVFKANMGLVGMDIAQYATTFGKKSKGFLPFLGRLGFNMGSEGVEEGIQYIIPQEIQGKNWSANDQELIDSVITGALMGGVMHGVGSAGKYAADRFLGQGETQAQNAPTNAQNGGANPAQGGAQGGSTNSAVAALNNRPQISGTAQSILQGAAQMAAQNSQNPQGAPTPTPTQTQGQNAPAQGSAVSLDNAGSGEGTYWKKQTDNVSYDGARPETMKALDLLGQWFYQKTGKPLVVTAVTNGDHAAGEHSHGAGWKADVNDYGSGGAEGTLLGAGDGEKGTLTDEFIRYGQSLGLGMNWEGDHIDVSASGEQWEGEHAGKNFGGLKIGGEAQEQGQSNLSGGTNEEKIWSWLKSEGFTDEGAAGIMGNFRQEAGEDFATNAVENNGRGFTIDGKTGYGLAQWTSAERQRGLLEMAESMGKDVSDLDVQLAYLKKEMQERGIWDKVRNAQDLREATRIFHDEYEGSGDYERFGNIEHRHNFANEYYGKYGGKTYSGAGQSQTTQSANAAPQVEIPAETEDEFAARYQEALNILESGQMTREERDALFNVAEEVRQGDMPDGMTTEEEIDYRNALDEAIDNRDLTALANLIAPQKLADAVKPRKIKPQAAPKMANVQTPTPNLNRAQNGQSQQSQTQPQQQSAPAIDPSEYRKQVLGQVAAVMPNDLSALRQAGKNLLNNHGNVPFNYGDIQTINNSGDVNKIKQVILNHYNTAMKNGVSPENILREWGLSAQPQMSTSQPPSVATQTPQVKATQPQPTQPPQVSQSQTQPAPQVQAQNTTSQTSQAQNETLQMQGQREQPQVTHGAETKLITDREREIPARYRVMEAGDIISSHNADFGTNANYPAELQPRDRGNRQALMQQITSMSQNLRPDDLMESRNLNQGAPVIRNDGVVLNGNGRVMAISRAYGLNMAENYKEALKAKAQELGLNPADIEKMKNPVLVREVSGNLSANELQDVTTSTTGGARLGAGEQARADAEKLTEQILNLYVPNEYGDLTTANNREFVSAALRQIAAKSELNAYTDAAGNVNADGVARVKRAVFALAYGDERIIGKMAESANDVIKNITGGLSAAAPIVAKAEINMKQGEIRSYPLAEAVSEAVKQLDAIRAQKKSVKEYLREQGMFAEHEFSAESKEILAYFDAHRRSMKSIGEYLAKAAQIIEAQGSVNQTSLIETEPLSLMDVLKAAKNSVENKGGQNLTANTANNSDNENASGANEKGATVSPRTESSNEANVSKAVDTPINDIAQESENGKSENLQTAKAAAETERESIFNEEEVSDNELNDNAAEVAERDGQENSQDGVGQGVQSERPGGDGGRNLQTIGETDESQDSVGVRESRASARGTTGNSRVQAGESADNGSRAGSAELSGSIRDSLDGTTGLDDGRTAKDIEFAKDRPVNAGSEQVNKKAPFKAGSLELIRADLPSLLPEQAEDVVKAEKRLLAEKQNGILFTNGTGTGKTFTGLGVVKRFVNQGKKNIAIITPKEVNIKDWVQAAKEFFGLNIHELKNTKYAGEDGHVIITTYANFGQNQSLVKRNWDLIVADESHYFMSNEAGADTNAITNLRAITYHLQGFYTRTRALHAKEYERQGILFDKKNDETITAAEEEELKKLSKKLSDEESAELSEWENMKEEDKPKVVFLSATPFSYLPAVDYANGYLFHYDHSRDNGGGYNHANGREQFFIEHFGYRMRFNKLTRPDADVNQDLMAIQFNTWLRETGALSGRTLKVDKDYERGFILVDSGVGAKIDEGMKIFEEDSNKINPQYGLLAALFREGMKGLKSRHLLEAIKAKQAIPLINEYLAAGKKVVLFHDYKENKAVNPFVFDDSDLTFDNDPNATRRAHEEYERFKREHPELINLDLSDLKSPIDVIKETFGKRARIFNGSVPKSERPKAVKEFNDDNSGVDIILILRKAGKEGISLHDTTGKHQRVLIDFGLATSPTDIVQTEGRIYRTGVVSNAIIRYLNTGTQFERTAFASTIAGRAATAEYLAMGEEARSLRESIVESFEESVNDEWQKYLPNTKTEGTGGKERDRRREGTISEYDKAKTFYYGRQKKTSQNKAREGKDYYATPEPVGYKMVEWLGLKAGEAALEPSAGHGAISRWFPADTRNTIIEPSGELSAGARMTLKGGTTSKVIGGMFENFDLHNKADGIAMNPPFGTGGKTAVEHIAKAYKHLNDGGRLVAILPEGASADAHFNKWFYGEDKNGEQVQKPPQGAVLTAQIHLPSVTFNRAGTSVATRIVVIDKQLNPAAAEAAESNAGKDIDLRGIDDIKKLFDRMENMTMPKRLNPAEYYGRDTGRQSKSETTAEPEHKQTSDGTTNFEAGDFTHTKTGEKIPQAKFRYKVEREVYDKIATLAKNHGGKYSRFSRSFLFRKGDNNGRDAFLREAETLLGANDHDAALSISAWHGSGASNIERLSLKYIGTGEGAQVHGYGLYFAGNRAVSEGYRENLGGVNTYVEYKGKKYTAGAALFEPDLTFAEALALNAMYDAKGDKEEAERNLLSRERSDRGTIYDGAAFEAIDIIKNNEIKITKEISGSLLEVEIPDADVMLDEQKTFDEQPPKVREALREIGGKFDGLIGKTIYNALVKKTGSPKKASELLNEHGIKGITYEGGRDGRCYVVFDDQAIDIINRFSLDSEANAETKELLASITPVDNEELTAQEKLLSDFSQKLGVPLMWVDADPALNGRYDHYTGVIQLNRKGEHRINGERNVTHTFWHELLHWLSYNNQDIYSDWIKYIHGHAPFTKKQIAEWKKANNRNNLSEAAAVQEMLCDYFTVGHERMKILRDMAKENPSLARRFVAWIKRLWDRFAEMFHNPQGKLTTAQKNRFDEIFAKTLSELKDRDGKPIFKTANRGREIRLFDGRALPQVSIAAPQGVGVFSFAGEKAKTADKATLERAKAMEQSEEYYSEEIYDETGWFKGKDNKWRFEIPDNLDKIDFSPLTKQSRIKKIFTLNSAKLGDIYDNPELYRAYPFLQNIYVHNEDLSKHNANGIARPRIKDKFLKMLPYQIDYSIGIDRKHLANSPEEAKSTLVHEIQHIIQMHEGFALGGNGEYAKSILRQKGKGAVADAISDYEAWALLGGEQEAMEVQKRAKIQKRKISKRDYEKARNELEHFISQQPPEMQEIIRQDIEVGQPSVETPHEIGERLEEFFNIADTYFSTQEKPNPHNWNALIVFGGQEFSANLQNNIDNSGNLTDNEDGSVVDFPSEHLTDTQKQTLFETMSKHIDNHIAEQLKEGKKRAEVTRELLSENSRHRAKILGGLKATVRFLENNINDKNVKQRRVESYYPKAKNWDVKERDAKIDEAYRFILNQMKEAVNYAGVLYREIATNRYGEGGNSRSSIQLHSWRDAEKQLAERERKARAEAKQNTPISESTLIQGAFSNGRKYSIDAGATPERSFLDRAFKKMTGQARVNGERIITEERKISEEPSLREHYFGSPSRIAEKYKMFRPFFRMADKAMNTLTKNRSDFARKLEQAKDLVKSAEDKEKLYGVLWQGDMNHKEWTREELINDGYGENIAEAYIRIRRLLKKAHEMVNEAKRRPQIITKNLTDAQIDKLRENKFVEILKIGDKDVSNQTPLKFQGNEVDKRKVTYKEYANWIQEYDVSMPQLYRFENDDAMQVLEYQDNGDGTFHVVTREAVPPVGKRKGYIPHFFHEYMIQVLDKNGNPVSRYGMGGFVGTGKTEVEAVKKADEWLKNAQLKDGEQVYIAPKTFDFSHLGMDEAQYGAIMGDQDYDKMVAKIAKANSMTLTEVKKFLADSVNKKNRHRFFGNLMHRKGVNGYEEDMDWVLSHYFNSASRYHAMETEFKPQAISLFERWFGDFNQKHTGLAEYVQDYINDINGNPSTLEKKITDTLNKSKLWRKYVTASFGERSALKFTSTVTGWTSYLCLGYLNASSALLNLSQAINVTAYLGDVNALPKLFVKGFKRNYGLREMKILRETNVMNDIGLDSGAGYDVNRGYAGKMFGALGKLSQKGMILFKTTESAMRRGAVLVAYEKARKDGKSHQEAIAYAKSINRKSNFDYGVSDAPNIFRRGSVVSQLVLQFKKYGIKELEVMGEMLPYLSKSTTSKQKMLFWGMYFLTCGLMGLPALNWLDDLLGENLKDFAQETIMELCGDSAVGRVLGKTALYGLAAPTVGIDLSNRAGLADVIPMPYHATDLGGAAISKTANFVRDVFGKGDYAAGLRDLSPGIYNQYAAWIAGESTGTRGRVNSRYDGFYDRMIKAMGFKSTDERIASDIQRIMQKRRSKLTKDKQAAVDAYLADPTTENAKKLKELGIKPKTVQEERERKKQDRLERLAGNMNKQEAANSDSLLKFAR